MSLPPTPALFGQHVVVLGGSSGIGYATAALAHRRGATLSLLARDPARLATAAAGLDDARYAVADLTEPASLTTVLAELAPIDHLVITAGSAALLPLVDYTAASLRRIADERLVGPLLAIQAAVPHLRPGGTITLTSAQLAARPLARGAAMAGAVAAVEAITRALALELAPLRVNAVAPGLIDTPLLDGLLGEHKTALLADTAATLPVRAVGRAEQVAEAILFLIGNGHVSGEVLHVDGGGRWL